MNAKKSLINKSQTIYLCGLNFAFFGIYTLIPNLIELFCNIPKIDHAFINSSLICFLISIFLITAFKSKEEIKMNSRDIFITTSSLWIVSTFCGALPFWLQKAKIISFSNAIFESSSAITTTGWTIIKSSSTSITIWKSLLNWIGGLGVIILILAILPTPTKGSTELMHSEFSDRSEKFFPKISHIALSCIILYSIISGTCLLISCFFMPTISAICFSLSTVSTAGFSTNQLPINTSIHIVEWLAIIFSAISSIPFTLVIKSFISKKISKIAKNKEFQTFILIWLISSVIMLIFSINGNNFLYQIKCALKKTILSLSTSELENMQESPKNLFLLVLALIGGCAGSTTGGFKITRIVSIKSIVFSYFKKQIHPSGVFLSNSEKKIDHAESYSILIFFVLFFILYFLINIVLMIYGFSKWDSMLGAISTISNVGITNLTGNEIINQSLSLKYILSFGMIIGRLELIPLCILFNKHFWKP